jgi:hypothetical protein
LTATSRALHAALEGLVYLDQVLRMLSKACHVIEITADYFHTENSKYQKHPNRLA